MQKLLTSCQLPRRWSNTRTPSFTVLCSILREEVHTAPAEISSPVHPLVLNPLFQTRRRVPGFWKHTENQRAFLEKVGNELGIKKYSDWYSINREDVTKKGGGRLFGYYPSLHQALAAAFPEFAWDPERFYQNRAPHGHWSIQSNLLKSIERAEQILGIKDPADWGSVTAADLKGIAGFPAKLSKIELARLLREKYPDHQFEKVYLVKGRYSQQRILERAVALIFPNTPVIRNARREAGVLNPETNEYLEFDIFIPSLNLAIEFNEKHHYSGSVYAQKPLDVFQRRDKEKIELATAAGITLIVVPFWWDRKLSSLEASIKSARPDLLPGIKLSADQQGIPSQPPEEVTHEDNVEGIGQPITATFLTKSNRNVENWWIFEKYDGVRGFWNPNSKSFYSRKGNKLALPQHVLDTMPTDTFLDGELWFGRDNFQESIKISNRMDENAIDWKRFKFMVFDLPTHRGTYEERYAALAKKFEGSTHPYIEVAPMQICTSMDHLEKTFQDILDMGGEGVILRDPTSPYQEGRSAGYLKHKKYRDAEARIIRSHANQWECELPNGATFIAGAATQEFTRRFTPKPGDIVSFKHHGFLLTSKKPKLAVLHRLRPDLTWEDVLANWKEQKSGGSLPHFRRQREDAKPKSYWRNIDNRRAYFNEAAKKLGFDPLQPENWKLFSSKKIRSAMGPGPIDKYKGSLREALTVSFPEIQFTFEDKDAQREYWQDVNNQRAFFVEYAKENGFDPYHATSWYNLDLTKMKQKQGGERINRISGWKKALRQSFPELKFLKWFRHSDVEELVPIASYRTT